MKYMPIGGGNTEDHLVIGLYKFEHVNSFVYLGSELNFQMMSAKRSNEESQQPVGDILVWSEFQEVCIPVKQNQSEPLQNTGASCSDLRIWDMDNKGWRGKNSIIWTNYS